MNGIESKWNEQDHVDQIQLKQQYPFIFILFNCYKLEPMLFSSTQTTMQAHKGPSPRQFTLFFNQEVARFFYFILIVTSLSPYYPAQQQLKCSPIQRQFGIFCKNLFFLLREIFCKNLKAKSKILVLLSPSLSQYYLLSLLLCHKQNIISRNAKLPQYLNFIFVSLLLTHLVTIS